MKLLHRLNALQFKITYLYEKPNSEIIRVHHNTAALYVKDGICNTQHFYQCAMRISLLLLHTPYY